MKVNVLTTQPQFWRHIKPIFEALPVELRGEIIGHEPSKVRRLPKDDVFLVGGAGSIDDARGARVIYVEHGAGQTYKGLKPRHAQHYSGGLHAPNVIGYICPSQRVADAWKRPAVVVGCPAVDHLKRSSIADRVVITFHWDAPHVSPEARSARPHYVRHLHEIVQWVRSTSFAQDVLGHWHPRDAPRAKMIWERLGVEMEPDADTALQRARLVIADNTSFAYEAAHMGIHNISLNAPWYRRNVEHGLRFWEAPPGHQVDDVDDLLSSACTSLLGDPRLTEIAKIASECAYGIPHGGNGAKLASEFIQDLVG